MRGRALSATGVPASALTSGGRAVWTWFNQPEAVYDATEQVTAVGATASDATMLVYRYHHPTGRVRPVYVGLPSGGTADDHNNPVAVKLDAGGPNAGLWLYAAAKHVGESWTRRQRSAAIPGGVTAVRTVDGGTPSYAVPVQFQDTARTLYLFHRRQPPTQSRSFRTSADGGDTWAAAVPWLSNTTAPYPQYSLSADGLRLDAVVTNAHPADQAVCSLYHFYLTVAADGSRNWYKGDGTLLSAGDASLPLDPTAGLLVYDGSTTNSWVWDLCEVEGVLTLAYTHRGTGGTLTSWATNHYYRIARFVGGSWVSEDVCDGGGTGADYLYASQSAYSGGICLDPDDRSSVVVSRKYGSSDFRVERWARNTGSGVWSKAVTVSPTTRRVYARPRRVRGSSPSRFVFWGGTYTSFSNYSTDLYHWPPLPVSTPATGRRAKPASPAWQAGSAPAGVSHYYPVHEGSGTTLTDLVPSGAKDGTFTGSPSWSTGVLGPQLGNFATTRYVAIDPASQPVATGSHPWWVAVCCTVTSTASESWPLSFGRSSSDTPVVGFRVNNSVGVVASFVRDDAGTSAVLNLSGSTINDGSPHVLMYVQWASGDGQFYFDGVLAADTAAVFGTTTLNQMTVGALRRTSVINPHKGDVLAVACGSGDAPDPMQLAEDWLYGDFAAVRP